MNVVSIAKIVYFFEIKLEKMSKKILFMIDRLNEGAGRVVYDLVKNLDENKFEPIVVSLYNEGNLISDFDKLDVKIIYLNKKSGKDLGLISKLKNLILKAKIGVVHTHNVDAYEYGVLAAWLAGIKRRIHTAHGKSVKENKLKKLRERIFHKFISLFLDDYIVVSKDLERYVSRNWCLNKNKIKTIYNGIDTSKYKKIKVKKNFLYKLGVNKNDFLIGIIAGLRPVKDHVTLIKAMKIVKKEIPNSKLLVVGDGPEKEKLVNLVKKFNLKEDILFLGNRKDIVKLLNCLDVGVLCSLSECLSVSLLEGMACGLPFVVTNVGGNPELITDGKNGFLVPVKEYKILANRIVKLLKDKRLRKKIGEENRKKIMNYFNVKDMIKNYEKIYNL